MSRYADKLASSGVCKVFERPCSLIELFMEHGQQERETKVRRMSDDAERTVGSNHWGIQDREQRPHYMYYIRVWVRLVVETCPKHS